ncbi:MAG: pyridoxamine 5'-phosphate oxidase family protein [Christensenellales bacterium]
MFREMRLSKRKASDAEAERLLSEGVWGVLAVLGDGGYPYAVPLNYAYENGRIYFHCAKEGHKTDAIAENEKLSFCVVECANVMPKEFTSLYRSVIAFGKGRVIEDEGERLRAIRLINAKYSPGLEEEGEEVIKRTWRRFDIVEIKVEHMTCKENNVKNE